jgi:DNA polymerase-3 subunit delta
MKESKEVRSQGGSVFLLEGGEPFLQGRSLQRIVAHYGGKDTQRSDINMLSAGDVVPADVFDELRSAPLFSLHKIVVLKDADKFVQDHRELVRQYLKRPSDTNVLVIMVESIKGISKIAEQVKAVGKVISSKTPYENEVPGWIMARCRKRYRKKMSVKDATLLHGKLGDDLGRIDSELNKLSLYVGDRDAITEEDIERGTWADRDFGWFALPDAIAKKEAAVAQRILAGLLSGGSKAPEIIGSIAWQLKRIWKARRMLGKGAGFPEIFKAFNVRFSGHQETLKKLVRQFSERDLARQYEFLQVTDLKTKTGEISDRLGLEMLVARLCMK